MSGHVLAMPHEELFQDVRDWAGKRVPRSMSLGQYVLVERYASLGTPQLLERIKSAPLSPKKPLALEEFSLSPSTCVTAKSGGSNEKISGAKGSRVSA